MKTQDIQRIIEQAEACKVALRELQSRTSDAMVDTIKDGDDELNCTYAAMANSISTVIGIGTQAQINELLSLIENINKK